MGGDDILVFFTMFLGGLLLLFLDFRAIAWVGMWHGLKATKHHQAVLKTMGQIMLIPWIIIFFLIFLERGFRSAAGAAMTVMIWVFVGAIVGGLSAKMARNNLESRLRSMAAGQRE